MKCGSNTLFSNRRAAVRMATMLRRQILLNPSRNATQNLENQSSPASRFNNPPQNLISEQYCASETPQKTEALFNRHSPIGFEVNVTALSALTPLQFHQITGNAQYLEGSYVQLAADSQAHLAV
jgi:hypothetical protein